MNSGAVRPGPVGAAAHAAPYGAPWWLAAIALVTVIGFQPAVTRTARALDLAHVLHGVAALGWSVILVSQAWLAAQRRRDAHRLVAVAGVLCAIGLVSSAVPMLTALAAGATAHAGFRTTGLWLLAMDVLLLLLFMLLFAVAVAFVRRPPVHARALAATGLLALPAGLGRLYMRLFAVDPVVASLLALGSAALLVTALIVADRRAGVRDVVHPLVLAAVLTVPPLSGIMADATWFAAWAQQLAGA